MSITKKSEIESKSKDRFGRVVYVIEGRRFIKCPTYSKNPECFGYMSYAPWTKFCTNCKIKHNKEVIRVRKSSRKEE